MSDEAPPPEIEVKVEPEINEEPKEEATGDAPPLPPPPPLRKIRWGASMLKDSDDGAEKKSRKRKSRWETELSSSTAIVVSDGSRALVAVFPKSVRLTNGIQVRVI